MNCWSSNMALTSLYCALALPASVFSQIALASFLYWSLLKRDAFLSALKGNAPLSSVAGRIWPKPWPLTNSPGKPSPNNPFVKSAGCMGTSTALSPLALMPACTISATEAKPAWAAA